jgi:hypothetical protein
VEKPLILDLSFPLSGTHPVEIKKKIKTMTCADPQKVFTTKSKKNCKPATQLFEFSF